MASLPYSAMHRIEHEQMLHADSLPRHASGCRTLPAAAACQAQESEQQAHMVATCFEAEAITHVQPDCTFNGVMQTNSKAVIDVLDCTSPRPFMFGHRGSLHVS